MTPTIRMIALPVLALTLLAGAAHAQTDPQAGSSREVSRNVPTGTGLGPVCNQLELSAGMSAPACGRLSLATVARQFFESSDDEKRK